MPDIGSNLCLFPMPRDPWSSVPSVRLHGAGRPQKSDKGARPSANLKALALPLLQETLNEPETLTDQQEANEPMQPLRRKAGRLKDGSRGLRNHESARPAGAVSHGEHVFVRGGRQR